MNAIQFFFIVYVKYTMKIVSIKELIISIIIGIISGVMGPYTGIGGSVILPLLLLFKLVPNQKSAIATYYATAPSPFNIFMLYNFWNDGYILIQLSLIIGIIYAFTSYYISKYHYNDCQWFFIIDRLSVEKEF